MTKDERRRTKDEGRMTKDEGRIFDLRFESVIGNLKFVGGRPSSVI